MPFRSLSDRPQPTSALGESFQSVEFATAEWYMVITARRATAARATPEVPANARRSSRAARHQMLTSAASSFGGVTGSTSLRVLFLKFRQCSRYFLMRTAFGAMLACGGNRMCCLGYQRTDWNSDTDELTGSVRRLERHNAQPPLIRCRWREQRHGVDDEVSLLGILQGSANPLH